MSELLDRAIEAAGGRRRWRSVERVSSHVRSGGLMMRMKGRAGSFRDYEVSVNTELQNAVLRPYPDAGSRGVFDAGTVRIEGADGAVRAERQDARQVFFGLSGVRRKFRWDVLDALYFAGYALWNYFTIPFLLDGPRFEVSEGDPLEAHGERWRRLDVVFPDDLHTHCGRQALYFDSSGLLRRHDYHPDIVSSRANAVHLCDGHREFGGLMFATERRVVPKGLRGRPLSGPTIVSLSFDSIAVE